MADLNIPIEWKTRGCTVKNEPGYFHCWENYSEPIAAELHIGGAPAGVFSKIFGIVEFADGVRRVDPTDICFCDEENTYLAELKRHILMCNKCGEKSYPDCQKWCPMKKNKNK